MRTDDNGKGGWELERNAQKGLLMREVFFSLFLITKLSGKTLSLEPKDLKTRCLQTKRKPFVKIWAAWNLGWVVIVGGNQLLPWMKNFSS